MARSKTRRKLNKEIKKMEINQELKEGKFLDLSEITIREMERHLETARQEKGLESDDGVIDTFIN
jgi:hypothetical protein